MLFSPFLSLLCTTERRNFLDEILETSDQKYYFLFLSSKIMFSQSMQNSAYQVARDCPSDHCLPRQAMGGTKIEKHLTSFFQSFFFRLCFPLCRVMPCPAVGDAGLQPIANRGCGGGGVCPKLLKECLSFFFICLLFNLFCRRFSVWPSGVSFSLVSDLHLLVGWR